MEKEKFLELYLTDRQGTNCSKWDGSQYHHHQRSAAKNL